MSDTPLTDKLRFRLLGIGTFVKVEDCEDIERKLAEANKKLADETKAHADWLYNAQELQKGYNELDKRLKEANARIAELEADRKRLDTVQDKFWEVAPHRSGLWRVTHFNGVDSTLTMGTGVSIRQAIDAAMKKGD